jgi:phage anti-repressor protein
MIKTIIRIIYSPIQIICDAIHHQRKQRLMMSHTLKINSKKDCALVARDNSENSKIKINLAHNASHGA